MSERLCWPSLAVVPTLTLLAISALPYVVPAFPYVVPAKAGAQTQCQLPTGCPPARA